MFFSQTPGRHPPLITGFRVNSVTLGWVGAPNESAPFRFHYAIAVFADRCLTRARIADQGFGRGFMRFVVDVSCLLADKASPPDDDWFVEMARLVALRNGGESASASGCLCDGTGTLDRLLSAA